MDVEILTDHGLEPDDDFPQISEDTCDGCDGEGEVCAECGGTVDACECGDDFDPVPCEECGGDGVIVYDDSDDDDA